MYIYDKHDFETLPVIHIDFSYGISHRSTEMLETSLQEFLKEIANKYEVEILGTNLEMKFQSLIKNISEKTGKEVVILIDEYDKSITDNLDKIPLAEAHREILRSFYSGLKGSDTYLKMVFITGVSRFAKVSIFSMLNNLTEISLDPKFNNLVGFKPSDIEMYFEAYLTQMEVKFGSNREEILAQIKYLYNGYSWDGKQRVYNPFSLTHAFYDLEFGNYWFQSGTPKFLVDMIRKQQVFIPELDKLEANIDVKDSMNLSELDLVSLLFQTGYLTVDTIKRSGKYRSRKLYELQYPNQEVQESMYNYLLADNVSLHAPAIMPLHMRMNEALDTQDMKKFLKYLKALYAKIPARLHLEAEAYYHSLFYMMLHLLGAKMKLEEEQAIGRVDAILEIEEVIYIIECKYSEKGKMDTILEKAMTQIHNKKYYGPYLSSEKKLFLLALGFIGRTDIDLKLEELNK